MTGNQTRFFSSEAASTAERAAPSRRTRRGARMSRLGSALGAVALVGAALVPLALAVTVAPASAATFNVQPVPGTRVLNEVACPTATTCVAVGQFDDATGGHGVVVPITNGVPGAAQVVAGTGVLFGVACSDATTCVAVGRVTDVSNVNHAVVVPFTITNGSLVVGSTQTLSVTATLNSVACYSATSCVAVGGPQSFQGVVVAITNGTAGPAQFVANVRVGLTGVACYSPTACTAVGLHVVGLTNDGVLVAITNGSAGVAQRVTPTRNLNRIACGPSICEATGTADSPRAAAVLQVINGVPGTLQLVPELAPVGIGTLLGISCPTDTLCEAVGNADTGVLVPVDSGVPGTPQPIPGTAQLFGIACTSTATSCIAVGSNSDPVGVVVTPKARPTISTQASPGNLLGAPVTDTATLSGASNPTGDVTFRLFSDAACATQVFSSTNNVSGVTATSDSFTPPAAGTYHWTAAYSGDAGNEAATSPCGAPNESVVIAPFAPPTFTRTITGDLLGPVIVNAGDSVLITGARVVGPVTVNPGGALSVVNSQISQGITANAPRFLSLCGAQVSGPSRGQALGVSNAAVPIRIGDPAAGCAGNRFAGTVNLTSNLAVTFGANIVSSNVNVTNNGPGNTVIKGNNVFGALACAGNNPPPANAGQTNTAGSKSGQCSAL